jgi:porin
MSRLSTAAVVVGVFSGISTDLFAKEPSSDTEPSWNLSLGYTSDFWRNLDGGVTTGDVFIGNAELIVDIEGSPGGFRSRVRAIHNNGKSFSEIVGDTHVISNIEADRATRILEAWTEYASTIDDRSLKFGIYDLNTEFDVSEVGGALINSTFGIGVDVAQSGAIGPSIFPYTGLALRGRWRFDERWMLQGVVIDGVPNDPDSPRKLASLKIDAGEGALWVAELEHRTERWRAVVGHWRYSVAFEEFDGLSDGSPRSSSGNSGTYGLIEGPIWQAGDRRLLAMLRIGAAEPKFSVIESTIQAALVLERPWLGREGEHVALGVAYAQNGSPARRRASVAGESLLAHESLVELSWRVPVTSRLVLQPDLHYIFNPGSRSGLKDAFALGLRVELDLTPH